ncbi:MAG: GAF domain-containing protein [bacterium]
MSILYSTAAWHIKAETEAEIIRVGLDRLNEVLKPEISAILILEDGFLKIKGSSGIQKSVCEKTKIEIGTGTAGEVFLTGIPIIIEDLSKDPSFVDPFIKNLDVKSVFCYPIRIEDSIAGVIWVGFLSSYLPLKEEEWLVSLVAERIARSLEIYRLKEK